MKFQIITKKNGSHRELGRQTLELDHVETLEDLLQQVCADTLHRAANRRRDTLTQADIQESAACGKVDFGDSPRTAVPPLQTALHTMVQDFHDGLLRVYVNGHACTDLTEKLVLQAENEVVFLRLILLAGRLW